MECSKTRFNHQKHRVLLLSDIHGNHRAFQRLVNMIKPQKTVDYILIAGDIAGTIYYPLFLWSIAKERRLSRSLYAELVYGRARENFVMFQIKTVQRVFEILKRIGKPTVLTFGNTDTPEVIEEIIQHVDIEDNIYFLQTGESIALAEFHIVAIGGATYQPSNRGFTCPHDYDERQYTKLIEKTEKRLAKLPKEKSILLTHEAPFNTCTDRLLHLDKHVGSKPLRNLIKTMQPLIHCCGHFHESQGVCMMGKTTLINPGALIHYEYAICEIDLSATKIVLTKLLNLPKNVCDPVELIYRLNRNLYTTM
ncbi:MAG: metallophosphoesterase [Candidatus Hodarchaeota archaeon]